jgi:hypothetical protein
MRGKTPEDAMGDCPSATNLPEDPQVCTALVLRDTFVKHQKSIPAEPESLESATGSPHDRSFVDGC